MSAREEVAIGGNKFWIRKFEPFLALEIAGDLQKQFVAPLLSVLDGREAGSDTAVTAALMSGVERVLNGVDGKTLVAVARKLLNKEYISVAPQGEEARKLDDGAIAMHLSDMGDLIELCVEVARINFLGSLQRLVSRFGGGQLLQPIQSSPGSPTSSLPN